MELITGYLMFYRIRYFDNCIVARWLSFVITCVLFYCVVASDLLFLRTCQATEIILFFLLHWLRADRRFFWLLTCLTTISVLFFLLPLLLRWKRFWLLINLPSNGKRFFSYYLSLRGKPLFYPPTCGATTSNLQMLCCPSCCRPVANNF